MLLCAGSILSIPAVVLATEEVEIPYQQPDGTSGVIVVPREELPTSDVALLNRERLIRLETNQDRLISDVSDLTLSVKAIEVATSDLPQYIVVATLALGLFDYIIKKFVVGKPPSE